MTPASKKHLKRISIESDSVGFTVWIDKDIERNGRKFVSKHWIVDASCLKEDGIIRIGSNKIWSINVEYDKDRNLLLVTKKQSKRKISKKA